MNIVEVDGGCSNLNKNVAGAKYRTTDLHYLKSLREDAGGHGGSGTSHSAARAGVPSVVIPFAGDQFFWAERLRIAGVAPRAINGRRLEPQELREAVDLAATDGMRSRAQILGEAMRAEKGIHNAVAIVERLTES